MKAAIVAILAIASFWSVDAASLGQEAMADIDEYLAGFVLHRYTNNVREYLLLKKAKGDQEWQPSKGHIEDYDISPYAAAAREVEEETGLTSQDYQTIDHYLMHQYVAGDGTSKQVEMWPARVFNVNKPIVLSSEHSEYTWANIDRVLDLVNKRWRNNVYIPAEEFLNSLP